MVKVSSLDVDLLLPHKERFTTQNAGAVSTIIYALALQQTTHNKQNVTIFGTPSDTPKQGVAFQGLTPRHFRWQSRNIGMAKAYLHHLKTTNRSPDIVEVHGRPQVALYIAKARPDLKVILYLHNDPRSMKGAKTASERIMLAHKLAGIMSVSEYVKSCFLDGLGAEEDYPARIFVNLSGVTRLVSAPQKRKKQLFIASRMVPEKGILEACLGAVPVLTDHGDWQICLAGSKTFEDGALSPYETLIKDALAPLGDRAIMLGHQPLAQVRALQQTSEICLVPSRWEEPAGLTVLEALSAATALITTKRGGIPEYATGRAILLDEATPSHFEAAIRHLIEDPSARAALQQHAWDDYPFSAEKMSQCAADFRDSLQD